MAGFFGPSGPDSKIAIGDGYKFSAEVKTNEVIINLPDDSRVLVQDERTSGRAKRIIITMKTGLKLQYLLNLFEKISKFQINENSSNMWKMEPCGLEGQEPYGFHIIDKNENSLVNNEDGYFTESIAKIIVEALNKDLETVVSVHKKDKEKIIKEIKKL